MLIISFRLSLQSVPVSVVWLKLSPVLSAMSVLKTRKGDKGPSMSHLLCALGCDKDFCACCCQPPELPQRTPGQKWGSEKNSTELRTKLSPFMVGIWRGEHLDQGPQKAVSTSQIINSCTC